jgi:hypothetical protein
MPSSRDPDLLRQLQSEIESFLSSLRHPIVVENETQLFDLTAAEWRLRSEFGKLLFEAWNPARSIARRVEQIAYRDPGRMGIFVRKPGGRETGTLEFRELQRPAQSGRGDGRARFRRELLAMLGREFPDWKLERVSNRSDREHSFSACYLRGLARQGRTAWAFLGLGEEESSAAADAVLAFGLVWLDWLRGQSERVSVGGLKLFLPRSAVELIAHRATCLDRRALHVEIYAWNSGETRPAPVDLNDYGNVDTRLVPRRQGEALAERHQGLLRDLLGEAAGRVDVAIDPSGAALSLRVLGLEIARVEGALAPRVYFGLEGSVRRLEEDNRQEFREFVQRVLELRRARTPDPQHEFYRLQPERWLESLLVRDITKLDPALLPTCVYQQVPAVSGVDRGVIDILSITRQGRLAVIELKLHEEINLPLQGLDYWLRVKWLNERGQFRPFGYFPDLEPSPATPLLYLLSPAFRFHSTTGRLVRYFHPAIEVIQVGLNDRWREALKVLYRREMRATS